MWGNIHLYFTIPSFYRYIHCISEYPHPLLDCTAPDPSENIYDPKTDAIPLSQLVTLYLFLVNPLTRPLLLYPFDR